MKIILNSRKHHYVARLSIFLIILALIAGMAGCDSDGSQNLEIKTWYDLDDIRNNLYGHHTLMNSLNSTTRGWDELVKPDETDGLGWEPIRGFRGTFDGNGYEIKDLFINRDEEDQVGLFGDIAEAKLKDIVVLGANVTGRENVGIVVGENQGTMENCSSSGDVTGTYSTGGLAGYNGGYGLVSSSVRHCESKATVCGGELRTGGLVGYNAPGGYIDSVVFGGNVTGMYQVGGLVGLNNREVKNSVVNETVTVTGVNVVSGTVGYSTPRLIAVVKNCHYYGHTNGGPYVGCDVLLSEDNVVTSLSVDSYKIGWYVGGVLGINEGIVEDCTSEGSVYGENYVGGLAGANNGTVENCSAEATVEGYQYVGGLAGANNGTVDNCSSDSKVTGDSNVGGLVGVNGGNVGSCISGGSVTGKDYVGGLVGYNAKEGTVSNSDSAANVEGTGIYVRDLIGRDESAVSGQEIWTWYDLHAIRDNLGGDYLLMNDLDSTTAGYEELAASTANQGKGWQPIRSLFADPFSIAIVDPVDPFTGSLDGQGYEIRDLFIRRPDEDGVGLFGYVGVAGGIKNLGVVNAEVIGHENVGGLVGGNKGGIVSNSYSTGGVTGDSNVGGLVGYSGWGIVSNSYSTSSVTGASSVGGLMGWHHWGTVSNSYSTGNVAGGSSVGGLVGANLGRTVSNSYYSYDEVLINGRNIITIGALSNEDFEQWLADDKFLDVNERLSQENGYYLINNVSDFKQLLAFGQDGSLKFRLKNDLDLSNEANFYIPYLAAEFDGNGHKISNLSFNFDFISQVGLFGYLASGGAVNGVSAENVNITGHGMVGGLVGVNDGIVSNSYSTGSVTGKWDVGGLVGAIHDGTVSNSYSTSSVTGASSVGGLLGWQHYGTVSNSYYNYDEVLINGENIITVGALFGEDFEQWLANDKFLDVNERLSKENGYYVINNVSDFKQLLAFGQDGSLKFRLKNDLDLSNEANFYIPYLAAEFDGNGHKIWNLSLHFDFVAQVGLFGYLASGGKVTQVGVENANITGHKLLGGLVGWNFGTVSNSYASGSVTGGGSVGGLVGESWGTVSNSYSTGSVTGGSWVGGLVGNSWGTVSNSYSTGSVTGGSWVGGLVGWNFHGTVSNSYSTGSVTGDEHVGGLVGANYAAVSNSLWDIQTSGQSTSAGGTGKITAEMIDIATFSGAGWNIIAVALGETNPAYTWNIVDGETYPLLSWQSLS